MDLDRARDLFRAYAPQPVKRLRQTLRDPKRRLVPVGAMPRTTVVMFHQGRSGSTVLGAMLDRHPAIAWDSEALQPERYRAERDGPPVDWLDRRRKRFRASHYGFEVKQFHLDLAGTTFGAFADALETGTDLRPILLRRRNLLRLVVSSTIKAEDGTAFARPAGTPLRLRRIRLDVARAHWFREPLVAFFARCEAYYAAVAGRYGDRLLDLVYEDDVADDPRRGHARICRHLGLDAVAVAPPYDRINPFPLRDMVENFDEVRAALAGTSYAWMAEDEAATS